MIRGLLLVLGGLLSATQARASDELALQRLREAQELFRAGQYFKSARYAFSAGEESTVRKAEAQAWVALSLVEAGLEQSASYFYVQTLRSGNREAVRRVLPLTSRLVRSVGLEFLRPFLVSHTRADDYPASQRPFFLYAAARSSWLRGDFQGALSMLSDIPADGSGFKMRAELLQLRGTLRALGGAAAQAIGDFRQCASASGEGTDLRNRCIASQARAMYEQGSFQEADRIFDQVSKQSLVWPEILFEQAWNSYRKGEFNRSLGKLVSYKSPALAFVYNPEIDVLRAQSYLSLCLYADANAEVNEFNARYAPVNDEVKKLTDRIGGNLPLYYEEGKAVAAARVSSPKPLHRLMNRFVRSASFQDWIRSERELSVELAGIRAFGASGAFPEFIGKVLDFRLRAIREMGGAFVRNSLLDYHNDLISQFEKIAFIKLEMLGRFKQQLMGIKSAAADDRGRGNVRPSRRDDQYYWSFNGEFWNDELGDYVFGLESECNGRS